MIRTNWLPYALKFKHPFGLSYGTRTTTEVVFVALECEGSIGCGEASLPPYLGETRESVIAFFKKAKAGLEGVSSNFDLPATIMKIDGISIGNNAAKAALDIALHDLKGKLEKKSICGLYGFEKPQPKYTSVTISIGDPDLIPEKVKEQSDFHILKIKLGSENDMKIIEAIRKCTTKKLVLDANQGWKDKDFALEMCEAMKNENILFIEQPLRKEDLKEAQWLMERSPIPIIADEAFKRLEDLDIISERYHGINIKLMKCTGIREAIAIIEKAKEKKLKINLGCMTESSCAISAAAQLMGLVDWIDLDGPLLINNDPFSGIRYVNGKAELRNDFGIAAELKSELLFTN